MDGMAIAEERPMVTTTALAVAKPEPAMSDGWTDEEIRVLKEQILPPDTSDAEMKVFLYACRQTRLNPFTRQIYGIPRQDRKTGRRSIQPLTGIDGFRAVAADTGEHAGTDDAVYTEENNWPVTASVTVYRMVKGQRCPYSATARWNEYVPQPPNDGMWKRMPYLMLAKVAEALALRKAFPHQLSGIYTRDEMDQAERNDEQPPVYQPPPPPPPKAAHAVQTSTATAAPISGAAESTGVPQPYVKPEPPAPRPAPSAPPPPPRSAEYTRPGQPAVRNLTTEPRTATIAQARMYYGVACAQWMGWTREEGEVFLKQKYSTCEGSKLSKAQMSAAIDELGQRSGQGKK